MSKEIKLHLGCGSVKISGYINIDLRKTPAVDLIADVFKLPFKEKTVDEIATFHLIEHFNELEGRHLLEYWFKLLKPGGKLVLECPNIVGMVKKFVEAYEKTGIIRPGYLYSTHSKKGREDFINDDHKWGYDQKSIRKLLESIGFRSVQVGEGTDYHAQENNYQVGLHIRAEAIK
jgi:predicted SAM-dependent methyltransferase